MTDHRNLLKIKLKSLAAESKIIRQSERKLQLPRLRVGRINENSPRPTPEAAKALRLERRRARVKAREASWYDENRARLTELQQHRRGIVRSTSRAAHLAYGYLRGKTLQQLEGNRGWLNAISAGDRRGHLLFVDRPVYAEAFKLARRYGVHPTPQTLDAIELAFIDWLKAGGAEEYVLPLTSQETIQKKVEAQLHLAAQPAQTPPFANPPPPFANPKPLIGP